MDLEQLPSVITYLERFDPWKALPTDECYPNASDAFEQGYQIAIKALKLIDS